MMVSRHAIFAFWILASIITYLKFFSNNNFMANCNRMSFSYVLCQTCYQILWSRLSPGHLKCMVMPVFALIMLSVVLVDHAMPDGVHYYYFNNY